MSEPSTAPARPLQVTVAAWMIMVGSVFVVLIVWDRIAGLHSLDTRNALQPLVDDPQMKKAGLGLHDVLTVIKVLSMVAAGCATAMVVLGYQTLQRSRSARLALTVLAVPLFVTGLASGGYVSSAVAAAVGTLWLPPARTWFAPETAASPAGAGQGTRAPVWPPPYDPGAAQPSRPTQPTAPAHPSTPPAQTQPAGARPQATGPVWAPPPVSRYDAFPAAAGRTRPQPLVWACILTWFFGTVSAVVLTASIVVLGGDHRAVLDKAHEQNPNLASQGVSDHLILVVLFVMCGLFVVWSLAAVGLAVLAFRGKRWGWYGLLASTSGAVIFCLLGTLGSLAVLVPLVAAVVTLSCLVRTEVRAWFG